MAIKKRRPFPDAIDSYFRDFEREFEKWTEAFIEKPSWSLKNCSLEPLSDMRVTPTEVVVTVDMPMSVEKSVQVKPLNGSTLEISAQMRRKVRFREMGITHYEGEFQKLHCNSRVPVPVQMEKMKVKFKKGMLEVHIPRRRKR